MDFLDPKNRVIAALDCIHIEKSMSIIDLNFRIDLYRLDWWFTATLDIISPCGCGDLSVRLGSRIGPYRHQVVVEVHWRGAQCWMSISWVVVPFNHVGGFFNLFLAITGVDWIIPSFRIWDYVLHVEHVSCVITNYGQHQWVIPSPLSIAL